uniref:Uncharacterized protein n=1 Tax=Arundo donax TaxID=35708 RepID=A0A0A9F7Z5_ARUDO
MVMLTESPRMHVDVAKIRSCAHPA